MYPSDGTVRADDAILLIENPFQHSFVKCGNDKLTLFLVDGITPEFLLSIERFGRLAENSFIGGTDVYDVLVFALAFCEPEYLVEVFGELVEALLAFAQVLFGLAAGEQESLGECAEGGKKNDEASPHPDFVGCGTYQLFNERFMVEKLAVHEAIKDPPHQAENKAQQHEPLAKQMGDFLLEPGRPGGGVGRFLILVREGRVAECLPLSVHGRYSPWSGCGRDAIPASSDGNRNPLWISIVNGAR